MGNIIVNIDRKPLAEATFTDLSSVVVLATATPAQGTAYSALSPKPRTAVFHIELQSCRYTDTGTAPHIANFVGEEVDVGERIEYRDSPDAIRQFKILQTAANARMTVRYYE